MESSWRDDHHSASSSMSLPIAPHGLLGHRRGPSELESTVLWDTSEVSGLSLGEGSTKITYPTTTTQTGATPTPLSSPLPIPIAVWAKLMESSKGRDKVLKCVQYTLRTYLYILSLIAAVRPLSPWLKANSKRMKIATSSLSLTRKCLLLLNPLHPLTHLLSPTPTSAPTIINHLIDLSSALSDDTFTLSRLGIVSRRKGKIADRWANRLWLFTTLMGLWTVYSRRPDTSASSSSSTYMLESGEGLDLEKGSTSREERRDVRRTGYKLWADLIFVSYDVFDVTWFKEPVQCAAGLCSAVISTSKLYDQYWLSSLKESREL